MSSLQPVFAQCPALPNQLTNGQVADATQVMANFTALFNCLNSVPGGSANAIQFNAGNGSLGGAGPLTNGQVIIGSTGNAPQAATLTAGGGVSISNAPGQITISAAAGQSYEQAWTQPHAANFPTTYISPSGSGMSVADYALGVVLSANATSGNSNYQVAMFQPVPTGGTHGWRVIARLVAGAPPVTAIKGGLTIRNSSNGKEVSFDLGYDSGSAITITQWAGYDTWYAGINLSGQADFSGAWYMIENDGTNLNYYYSYDGYTWAKLYTEPLASSYTGTPDQVGLQFNANAWNAPAALKGSPISIKCVSFQAIAY
ncbi:MAG: hypothetical protein ACYC5H_06590 [Methylovirgula sp.]